MKTILALLLSFSSVSFSANNLQTVNYVDVNKCVGHWYEIATIPHWFEKGCVGSTADVELKNDGKFLLTSRCFKDGSDGKAKVLHASAKSIDPDAHSKYHVSFFWPFSGDYGIVDLDTNYQFVAISNLNMSSLWIMSRTPQMDGKTYDIVVARLGERGFDVSRLKKTPPSTP